MGDPLRDGLDAGFRLGWKTGLTVACQELEAALAQAVAHGADAKKFGVQVTTIVGRLTELAAAAPELAVVTAEAGEVPDEVLARLGAPANAVKH